MSQVHELLAVDRRGAGETRQQARLSGLSTAVFRQPLRVRMKRRWRLDRTLRRRVAWLGFLLVLVIGLTAWQFMGRVQRPARAAPPEQSSLEDPARAPFSLRPIDGEERSQEAAHAQAYASVRSPTMSAQTAQPPSHAPSPQIRLQRGDLWLRIAGPRAAQRARDLLESALRELPAHGHGQAALAEACLRLGDERCARSAIERAIEARPQRSRFRQLSRDIERQFASQSASPP